ncbi:hypothetical protein MCAMS1_02651 [biofilm metagenome]
MTFCQWNARRLIAAGWVLLALVKPNIGQADDRLEKFPAKLLVGTVLAPPFVTRGEDGTWGGLSIDLMRGIAAELQAELEIRDYAHDHTALLSALEQRQIDMAIGTIPLSPETESRFDLSHPYFTSGIGIAVKSEPEYGVITRLLRSLQGVTGVFILTAIIGLTVLVLLTGTLMWFIERKRNPSQFDTHTFQGIGDGIWWAIVTMTFTGYGDKIPNTGIGRSVAMAWMFVSLCLLAVFSSTLVSSLTLSGMGNSINEPNDLKFSRVGSIPGTTGEAWLKAKNISVKRHYSFAIQACKALQKDEVEAVVYDKAILKAMIIAYGWNDLVLLPQTVAAQSYAIALPSGQTTKEAINNALLRVVSKPEWTLLVERTIGSET